MTTIDTPDFVRSVRAVQHPLVINQTLGPNANLDINVDGLDIHALGYTISQGNAGPNAILSFIDASTGPAFYSGYALAEVAKFGGFVVCPMMQLPAGHLLRVSVDPGGQLQGLNVTAFLQSVPPMPLPRRRQTHAVDLVTTLASAQILAASAFFGSWALRQLDIISTSATNFAVMVQDGAGNVYGTGSAPAHGVTTIPLNDVIVSNAPALFVTGASDGTSWRATLRYAACFAPDGSDDIG